MFIIFRDFLAVELIFVSQQVKRSMIISKKLVFTSCLTKSFFEIFPQTSSLVIPSLQNLCIRRWNLGNFALNSKQHLDSLYKN